MIDWHFILLNKNAHEHVSLLTLMNIISNYIPSKYITVDDKDPLWITGTIAIEISELISLRNEEYYNNPSKKLNQPNNSAKTYWSILKSCYKGKRVPLIPPFLVNNKIVSDFTEKVNFLNIFFASQCTPISNSSILPSRKNFKTNKWLFAHNIKKDDILKIIRKLNLGKVHGHGDISIRMLKICDSVITEPLSIIFKNCIDCGVFPDTWKMSHIIPAHKKNDKRSLNNYHPVCFTCLWKNFWKNHF